ncbi:MAG: metal-dependent hydrolase [Thermomicrobiales bacterium]
MLVGVRARWHGVEQACASPRRRFALGVLLLVLILSIDRWLFTGTHTLVATGIADETAHLSTMVIFLLAFPVFRNAGFVVGCLAGSVLIDLDHVPLYLGSNLMTEETNRPFTHGFLTVGIVLVMSLVAREPWRSIGFGLIAGLAAHFLRDMATSTAGVPLLWPLEATGFLLPYPLYATALVGALGWILISSLASGETQQGPGQ